MNQTNNTNIARPTRNESFCQSIRRLARGLVSDTEIYSETHFTTSTRDVLVAFPTAKVRAVTQLLLETPQ